MTITRGRPATAGTSTAPPPGERGGGSRRLAAIDGLRLLAALFVASYHFTYLRTRMGAIWGQPDGYVFPGLSRLGAYGFLGVELFFLISGFVICMSSWGRTAGAFARSRIVRLFPAYWPAVLITTAVVTLWPTVRQPESISTVLVNLAMLNEPLKVHNVDDVYWTLWVEAEFYLLFATVLLARGRGLTAQRATLFGFGWLVAAALSTHVNLPLLTATLQPLYAPYFVAGIAFYLIHRFGPDVRLWGLVGMSFAMAMYSVTQVMAGRRLNVHVAMLLVAVFFAVLAMIALGWTNRIGWRWLTTAGVLTYPFYLLHENIGWVLIHGLHGLAPRYVVLTGVTVLMLGAAWLLHRLVEKPFARWLRRRLDQLPPALAPAADPLPGQPPAAHRVTVAPRIGD